MINPLQVRNANFHFMELETLKDLYIHQLKDLQSAERQLVKALPQMAKTAINVAAAK
jgi:ferritin-like metal-binding protein YciE